MVKQRSFGFTLIEILIALFVFTIIAIMTVGGLHSVINFQSQTQQNAERFDQLVVALTYFQRDLEQTMPRINLDSAGHTENPLEGKPTEIFFIHGGLANPFSALARSTLQRTHYFLLNNQLIRENYNALDRTSDTGSSQRVLLDKVTDLKFTYLDEKGKFSNFWSAERQAKLPRAVRVSFNVVGLGQISQFYLIVAGENAL